MTRVKPYSKLTTKQKVFVVILPAIFAVYTPIAEIISFVGLAHCIALVADPGSADGIYFVHELNGRISV